MSRSAVSLKTLLAGLPADCMVPDVEVSGITTDSRDIKAGDMFIALKGLKFDARDFAVDALQAGAVVVLVDASDLDSLDQYIADLPELLVINELEKSLSHIAGRFYGHPSRHLTLIGVTGTNGKTTISYYLAQMLDKLGQSSAIIGTLGAGSVSDIKTTGMTTPDALRTQRLLAEMLEAGVEVVCMEVSSHALVLGRVAALNFDYLLYSNISQDHLDFHPSMQAYTEAKKSFFSDFSCTRAIVNADDALGVDIDNMLADKSLSYGITNGDLRALQVKLDANGLGFELRYQALGVLLNTDLIGEFNVLNILAVAGCGLAMGYNLPEVVAALPACQSVPGRMERIEVQSVQPVVVVDYAHTPDALDKALQACQSHCKGSLAVVFGCGGDRDKDKRSKMGRIAENRADKVFITDDNPRTESPAEIVVDIVNDMHRPAWVLHDRRQAINVAVKNSGPRDWVLIAGKGHESSQVYADHVINSNDRDIAEQALQEVAA